MDKELKKFLEDELLTHEEIIKSQNEILAKVLKHEKHIDSHTRHLEDMCVSLKGMKKTFEQFAALGDLADNIKTIAKFGRLVRICIVWLAGLMGGAALIWVSFRDGFTK